MPTLVRRGTLVEASESATTPSYVPEDKDIHKLHALEIAIIVATILFFSFVIAAGFLLRHAERRRRQAAALEEAHRERERNNNTYFGNYNEMALRGHYIRDSRAIEREHQQKPSWNWLPSFFRGSRVQQTRL